MKKQIALILPIVAALSILALNSVAAQNVSTPETNMSSAGSNMTNTTMGGNTTGTGNMTNSSAPMMTNSS